MDLRKSWTRRIKWFHPVSLQLCKEFAKVDGNYTGFNPLTIKEASHFSLENHPWIKGFRTRKPPSNQNLPYMMLKTKFPFLVQGPALIKKCQQLPGIVIWELYDDLLSCFLAHFPVFFFHFFREFFLCLWQLRSLLRGPPQRSTERSR